MTESDLNQLAAALPLMTGQEQAEALALLEADKADRMIRDMPDDVLDVLLNICGSVQLALGAEPASIEPHATDVAIIFDEAGSPLPYERWRYRRTGALMTDREKAGLGPITRWDAQGRHDVDPYSDEVLNLLPPTMRDRIRQAKGTGTWTAPLPIRRRMLEELDRD